MAEELGSRLLHLVFAKNQGKVLNIGILELRIAAGPKQTLTKLVHISLASLNDLYCVGTPLSKNMLGWVGLFVLRSGCALDLEPQIRPCKAATAGKPDELFLMYTSQLVINGTATQAQIARAFGVPLVTVKRYVKLHRQGGRQYALD
ncbi:MAG: hypothetical protein JO232_02565 [Verrucomicrobia bacterium]|nr:hypothetical protein [Verrucomicrobiota bacterium]